MGQSPSPTRLLSGPSVNSAKVENLSLSWSDFSLGSLNSAYDVYSTETVAPGTQCLYECFITCLIKYCFIFQSWGRWSSGNTVQCWSLGFPLSLSMINGTPFTRKGLFGGRGKNFENDFTIICSSGCLSENHKKEEESWLTVHTISQMRWVNSFQG